MSEAGNPRPTLQPRGWGTRARGRLGKLKVKSSKLKEEREERFLPLVEMTGAGGRGEERFHRLRWSSMRWRRGLTFVRDDGAGSASYCGPVR